MCGLSATPGCSDLESTTASSDNTANNSALSTLCILLAIFRYVQCTIELSFLVRERVAMSQFAPVPHFYPRNVVSGILRMLGTTLREELYTEGKHLHWAR